MFALFNLSLLELLVVGGVAALLILVVAGVIYSVTRGDSKDDRRDDD